MVLRGACGRPPSAPGLWLAPLCALLLAACGGGSGAGADTRSTASTSSSGVHGGGTPSAVLQAEAAQTPPDPRIVQADNTFGLQLFDRLLPSASGNLCISPLSVALVLQVLSNGAAGPTAPVMAQALDLGALDTASMNDANAALQAALAAADPSVEIDVANSLWVHLSQDPLLTSFEQLDETYYGATIGDLAGAPAAINAWVDAATHGLIPTIPQVPNYHTVSALLANVLYFKGAWLSPFNPDSTTTGPFTLGSGATESVSFMRQVASFPYATGSLNGTAFQAVRLPYGQGRFSLLIVLPAPGTELGDFVSAIDPAQLASLTARLEPVTVDLALPRFSSSFAAPLLGPLSSLGLGSLMCPSVPDLGAMFPLPYQNCVLDVEHATYIEVNEAGTVAAAATTVTIVTTVIVQPQVAMIVDRPFFYAIEDDVTGLLLFVGLEVDPG